MTDSPAASTPATGAAPSSRGPRMPRQERRRQLMDTARIVFAAEGFERTSMDAVAERAGVSKPVLYQHFTAKRELFLELLDGEVEELLSRLRTGLTGSPENPVRVDATLAAVFDYMGRPEHPHRIVFDSDAEHDPEVRARIESVHQVMTDMITRIVQEGTPYDAATAEVLARGIVGQVLAAARHWADRLDPQTRPDAGSMAEIVGLALWHGIGHLPDRVPDGEGDGAH